LLQQLTRSTPTIYDAAEARRHATADDPWAKAWLARNPAGFGSFALESCEPWRETIFRANPAGASTPAFDRVRFIAVPGRAKRLAMMRAGEIDLLLDLDPAEYLALQNVAGVQVHRARSGAHIAMMMQCQMPPFDNPLVRQAVAWAIPYRRILAQVYLGTATPWRSPLPWPTPMATEQFWRYDYDPDRARSLLTEAGFAGGFDTELFVDASNAEHGACGEIIVEALADIGIRVALERLDSGTFWFGGRYLRPFPMLIWEDWHQVPDPYYGLVHDYDPSRLGLINVGQYQSERISELIREVENEPSPVGRTALLTEAQRIIMAESPDVYLAQPAVMAATRDTIGGFFFPPDRALRFDLLTKDA
ncbi:MAG: ABC transporter substrate-binding protein, partial [Dehalococcoidia bacterium]